MDENEGSPSFLDALEWAQFVICSRCGKPARPVTQLGPGHEEHTLSDCCNAELERRDYGNAV